MRQVRLPGCRAFDALVLKPKFLIYSSVVRPGLLPHKADSILLRVKMEGPEHITTIKVSTNGEYTPELLEVMTNR